MDKDHTLPERQHRGHPAITLTLAAALALAATEAAPGQPAGRLENDFNAAVDRLLGGTRAGDEHMIGKEGPPETRLGLDLFWAEAKALADAHGPAATDFLAAKLTPDKADRRGPASRSLALAALAALAHDEGAASVLARSVTDRNYSDIIPIIAVTYAPPAVPRGLARNTLSAAGPDGPISPQTLARAAALLRLFGEEADAVLLRRAIDERARQRVDTREAPYIVAAEAELVALRQRLRRPEAERPRWAAQDLLAWRAANYVKGLNRSDDDNVFYTWKGLVAQGPLDVGYLRDRLGATPINSYELRMVIRSAAQQSETTLIPELVAIVARQRDGASEALSALLYIGTPEALGGIKRLIPPPGIDPTVTGEATDRAGLRARIIDFLTRPMITRPGAADLLADLAADPAYPPEERASFDRAAAAIREWIRLMGKSNSMMGQDPRD